MESMNNSSVSENLNNIKLRINEQEKKSNRTKDSVKLLAVSKFHTIEEIEEAIKAGQINFGENRVQEAFEKFSILKTKYPFIKLHIIGQLQTNKVKKAVEIADCIESVDRLSLVQEIEKQLNKVDKKIEIFFEFHTAEDSKSGFESYDELKNVLKSFENNEFPHIIPKGLMTMAPFTENLKAIEKSFKTLKNIFEKIKSDFPSIKLSELSMGMSNDFEIAIQEGSTEVRVGTAIFGPRDYSK